MNFEKRRAAEQLSEILLKLTINPNR